MKARPILFMLTFCILLAGTRLAFSDPLPADDPGWPRMLKKNGKELTIYQPQIDSWPEYKNIHVRFAIAVKDVKSKKETFGVAELDAETVVDQTARVVAVLPKTRELRFPNTSDKEAAALRKVVDDLKPFGQAMTVSLDRVLAYLDPAQQQLQPPVPLNLDPPKIFHSKKPAILVMILGEPQLQAVVKDSSELMFVANTNWDIFYDTGEKRYSLLNQESWLSSTDLINGPWTAAQSLPKGLSTLPADDNWAEVRKNIPGKPDNNPPLVLVSQEPAELILTRGEPAYTPIPDTRLLRLSNTDSPVFLNSGDGNTYFLAAGRWFRAPSLDGPWISAGSDLPADFARIPDNDPSAFVKASVPGTTEAKDAVLLASVPVTTAVDVATPAKVEVSYNGQPSFQAIPSTTVQYATNTASAVFLVNNAYYLCQAGVWYTSPAPVGPWAYCLNVPAAIYAIPPSHPTHNVTYVTVQSSTPSTVIYSQTAGYSGEYVAANGVLMFGAGMIVGALLNDHSNDYYHYPVPYSYGGGARYSYAYGGYYRAARVYGPYGGVGYGAAYNPGTGTYARGATAYGPGGSVSTGRAYNPYTGASAAGARVDTAYGSAGRGAAYNPSTGTAVRGGYRSNENGTVAGAQTNRGTGAVAWDTKNSQGAVVKGKSGDVYAGKDGNVYKRDSDGNWSSNSGSGWEDVNKPERGSNAQAQSQSRSSAGQTDRAQQRQDISQNSQGSAARASAQSQAQARSSAGAGQSDRSSQRQQPSRDSQFNTRAGNMESQAQARSRGNQLSQGSRDFGSGSANSSRSGGSGGRTGGGGGGRGGGGRR
jgi:hypothetical protein